MSKIVAFYTFLANNPDAADSFRQNGANFLVYFSQNYPQAGFTLSEADERGILRHAYQNVIAWDYTFSLTGGNITKTDTTIDIPYQPLTSYHGNGVPFIATVNMEGTVDLSAGTAEFSFDTQGTAIAKTPDEDAPITPQTSIIYIIGIVGNSSSANAQPVLLQRGDSVLITPDAPMTIAPDSRTQVPPSMSVNGIRVSGYIDQDSGDLLLNFLQDPDEAR